jgi:hypothetical protein
MQSQQAICLKRLRQHGSLTPGMVAEGDCSLNWKAMQSRWSVHYPRWIIDDGEPEREVGEYFQWSVVGFGSSDRLTLAASNVQSAISVHDYSYNVVGQVVHVSPKAAVIDFGLRAVGESNLLPTGCQAGEYVAGRIKLWLQHWCYPLPDEMFESMEQAWSVETILADLTPYRAGDETGSWFIRDGPNIKYEPVNSTREKNARAYALQCRLIPPLSR